MPVTDEEAARLAITSLDVLSSEQQEAQLAVVNLLQGEADSPFVDIYELFRLYNTLYFRGLLLPRVEVSWSKRLTLCAGICELIKDGEGKYRRIRLKLSEALLQFRPRSDTINTLLHEAIHAYFFVTSSHTRSDDPSGHGTGFQMLASFINVHSVAFGLNYDITIYHTFHDEVDSFRTHVWQCDGPCKEKAPFFGLVKRSMNRPPGKSDSWWSRHQEECGGIYTKIKEPEPTKEQLKKLSGKERARRQKNKIDGWLGQPQPRPAPINDVVEVVETSGIKAQRGTKRNAPEGSSKPSEKRTIVTCPICDKAVLEPEINEHLDQEHST